MSEVVDCFGEEPALLELECDAWLAEERKHFPDVSDMFLQGLGEDYDVV